MNAKKVIEEFIKKFFKEQNKEYENIHDIFHNYKIPFDSFDRVYALYLIDTNSKLLDIDLSDISKLTKEYFDNLLTDEEKEIFKVITKYAYDNYEREGLADYEAFFNIISVAKKGKEVTLKDSYYDGGWLGAS